MRKSTCNFNLGKCKTDFGEKKIMLCQVAFTSIGVKPILECDGDAMS